MKLLPTDLTALPIPAALLDEEGAVMEHSETWTDPGVNSTTYRIGTLSIVVNDHTSVPPVVGRLVSQLLQMIEAVADAAEGQRALRTRMLLAGLRVVAGRPQLEGGSIAETLQNLEAGVAGFSGSQDRSAVRLIVVAQCQMNAPVPDAAVLAHALKQLVTNACNHDGARELDLYVRPGPEFLLEWSGVPAAGGIATSRHQGRRERWGLGFVRLAADALGGVYLAPNRSAPGRLQAVVSVEAAPRLSLPLAAVGSDDRIERASHGWVEEWHSVEGQRVTGDVLALVQLARSRPETTVTSGSLLARAGPHRTWVALPPQSARDRARDVIRGLQHEQDLWEAPQAARITVEALAHTISVLLGGERPRMRPQRFDQLYPEACAVFGLAAPTHPYPGDQAPYPSLTAFLLAELDGQLEVTADSCVVRVPRAQRLHPLATQLGRPDGTIPLLPAPTNVR